MKCSVVKCNVIVKYSVVQYSTVQCSAVQCCNCNTVTVHYTVQYYITLNTLHYSAEQRKQYEIYSRVKKNIVIAE